jgi:outer membrane receptor protein involved in Fe transport
VRRLMSVLLPSLCGGIVALGPQALGAQEVSLVSAAERGPRFYAATSDSETMRPVEPSAIAVLRRRITFQARGEPLGQVLEAIAARSGLALNYSASVVPLTMPMSIDARNLTVAAVLTEVLMDADVDVVAMASGQLTLRKRQVQQVGVIVGRVTDARTELALVGATVMVEGARRGAATDDDGRYRIEEVPAGRHTLRVRYIGYTPGTASVTVEPERETTVDFALQRSAQQLDEVVTTGTLIPTEVKALPTPITIITAEDIERLHPRRIDELFRLTVPGAVVWEPSADGKNPGSISMAMRGASSLQLSVDQGSSNPKIYLDGIEVTGGAYGYYPSIDPQSIEQIEILRGPQAAAIYGSDAMGGVIQIFTKRGENATRRPQVELQSSVGAIQSNFAESGALRQDVSASVTANTGTTSFRLGGGFRRSGEWMPDYRERSPHLNGATRFVQGPLEVNLSARYEMSMSERGRNTLTHPLLGTPFCNAGCRFGQNSRTENKLETYGLRAALRPLTWWSHEVVLGLDRTTLEGQKYAPNEGDSLLNYGENGDTRSSFAYRSTVQGDLAPGLNANFTAGLDHYTARMTFFQAFGLLSIRPFYFAPTGGSSTYYSRVTNTGLFGQAQVALHDALFAVGSVRWENNSEFGQHVKWPTSTRAGLTYVRELGGATVKLRASYGQSIRPPAGGERDSIDFAPGCNCSIRLPNRDLLPERQSGPDMGFDLVFGRRGSLGVTYYSQIARDFIYLDFKIPSPGVGHSQYVNVARVKNDGWELEGTLQLWRLSARGTFAITRSRPTDLTGVSNPLPTIALGKQLPGLPKHTAALAVSAAALPRTSVTVSLAYHSGIEAFATDEQLRCELGIGPCREEVYDPADYLDPWSGQTKFNAAVDQEINSKFSAFLTVEDLTNTGSKRAVDKFSILPGRITTLGARLRL